MSGSGVTTTAKGLAERLRYRHFSVGAVFDAVADGRGVVPDDLVKLPEEDPSIDREIDELIQEPGIKEPHLVIDYRLAYHWIRRSFKLFLKVHPEVGVARELQKERANGRGQASLTAMGRAVALREESQRKRHNDRYGFDISNTKPFNLVVDTTNLTLDEVLEQVLSAYSEWLGRCK